MAKLGASARLVQEAFFKDRIQREFRRQNFDGHDAVHADLARAEDAAHAALPDFFENRKTADDRTTAQRTLASTRLFARQRSALDQERPNLSGAARVSSKALRSVSSASRLQYPNSTAVSEKRNT